MATSSCIAPAVLTAMAVVVAGTLLIQPHAINLQVTTRPVIVQSQVTRTVSNSVHHLSPVMPHYAAHAALPTPSTVATSAGQGSMGTTPQWLLAPVAFVLATICTYFYSQSRTSQPMTCLAMGNLPTSTIGRTRGRQPTHLRAGFWEKLFAPPRYEDDDDDMAAVIVEEDDEEMAGLRRTVLPGTFINSKPLVLAFDANRDGWYASVFHRLVDNRGSAVLIGKTADGVLFGAYNGVGWASTEVTRDTRNAFLFHYPSGKIDDSVEILPSIEGLPALFDSGSQGPSFGADGLRIPLGKPDNTRSKLTPKTTEEEEFEKGMSRRASSVLGTYYAGREDGQPSLFGENFRAELVELRVYVAK